MKRVTKSAHNLRASEAKGRERILYDGALFTLRDYQCHGHDTPNAKEEVSSSFDIVLPRSGLYVWAIGTSELIANVSHACLLESNLGYRVRHPLGGCDTNTVVSFSGASLYSLMRTLDQSASTRNPAHVSFPTRHVTLPPATVLLHQQLLNDAHSEHTEPLVIEEASIALCSAVLMNAFEQTRYAPAPVRRSTRRFYEERIHEVKLYLAQHSARSVSLAEVARVAALSPFHLSRVFKAMVGVPLHRYLVRLRLQTTLERLRHGAENLSQVALEAGFSSHSHYTVAMRSEFGLPPTKLRTLRYAQLATSLKRRKK